jgi:hypothetical protein
MESQEFSWKGGSVSHWDLGLINDVDPLNVEGGVLKEDLAQIAYPNGNILDIGWYPEFSVSGAFVISVVQNGDWEEPIFQAKCNAISELAQAIRTGIDIAAQ